MLQRFALRVLLSFNPNDVALAEAFRASLFIDSPDLEVFFSPILFEDYRPLALENSDAFVLFVGPRGPSERQASELGAARERAKQHEEYSVVAILAATAQQPQTISASLNWLEMPVVTDRNMMRKVVRALNGDRRANGPKLPTSRRGPARFDQQRRFG